MICKNCGKELSSNAKFCTKCGSKTELGDMTSAETQSAEVNPDSVSEPESESTYDSAASSSSGYTEPAENIGAAADIIQNDGFSSGDTDYIPAEPEPAAPAKLTAGRVTGAVAVSILTVIFLILFNLIFCARIGLSSDIVKSSADSLSMETILELSYDDNQTVAEYIYDNIDSKFISESGMECKDLKSIIIKSDLKSFIADRAESYAAYLINGSESKDPSLTVDEITEFFQDNEDVFEEELGYVYGMTKEDYSELTSSLEDEDFDEALSVGNLKNLYLIFSFITIGVLFAIVILLFIWIAIILDKNYKHIMGFIGNNLLIAGIIFLVPSVVFLIGSSIAAVYGGSAIAYICAKMLLPFAAVAACTGVFEIIVAVIFKKIKKHIKKTQVKLLAR
ncbi:MAG: zinc ribbon domain-containing protein [Ruminococcus sp.]|nr:zinc ribbon domain-containing protein [Ruminococcus sp.]